jgi:long-chain-fatty-acid--[acyl-carrier-protein] ligase
LEEIRSGIKKTTLISLLLRAKFHPSWFLKQIPCVAADQPAVILFTSGSEKAPKAVPLTHNNLLSNQKAGIAHLKFLESDVFLGFLPAFHSFGLSVTSLFPLALGIRVVHHPDPTDGAALAHKIRSYKVNVLLGTPTFLGMILDRSTPGDLASVRVAVFGAEKLSANLVERFKLAAPQMEILEGYGITECGPVVSANPPGATKTGSLGLPLPGTKVQLVDPDLGEPVKTGDRGMLLVSSASVFPGYDGSEDNPFEQRDGLIWYRTGDLCRQDEAGYLFFEGRLKRFLKAGGEMVSLPALEDSFIKRFPPSENGPSVAVEGTDDHGRRWIVLFCNKEIKLEDANRVLMEDGYRGVYRLDQVVVLPQIPVLGSGKTDYKQLRAQAIKLAPA